MEQITLLPQHYEVRPEFPNRIYYICELCGKELFTSKSQIRVGPKNHHFCCLKHRGIAQSILIQGKNNPNWNHRWSSSLRERQSKIMLERFKNDAALRKRVGATNRGKTKETCEHLKRAAEKRKEGFKTGRLKTVGHPLSEERKKKIGEEHREFMNRPEIKAKYRKMHENSGRWPKLSEKSDYQIYFKEAEWISKMFDLASDEEIKLIKKYGVFNCYKNTKGCVRDHKYSRRSGFKNGVFPQLLRHPCNCQIILHGNNVKKSFKVNQMTNTTDDVISLNDLFIAIENYAFEWVEQDLCLSLIKQYREGKRWVNPYKLPTS